ncbi:hypothetical protein Emag_002071 [Eimeria magna]
MASMDSAYYRHEAGDQPRPAGPQQVQQVQLVERRLQQEQQQQSYHQQQPQQNFFNSPLLQQQQQPACVDDACGARRYFVSPPFEPQNQQQQQQTPLIPFSVTYPGAPTTAPLGARGWIAELRLAAAAAATALQHIKENPIRRILVFFAFGFLCFVLLHAARQPQSASTRLTSAEAHGGICDDDYRENTLKLAHEASAFSLLADGWPERKFEASDVVASNKSLYFESRVRWVCDSSFALMKTGFGLRPLAPENALIGSSMAAALSAVAVTPALAAAVTAHGGGGGAAAAAHPAAAAAAIAALAAAVVAHLTSAAVAAHAAAIVVYGAAAAAAAAAAGETRQTHTFYVVREAVTHNPEEEDVEAPAETEEEQQQQIAQQQQRSRGGGSTKPFHAHIEELKVHGNDYTLQTTCKTRELAGRESSR